MVPLCSLGDRELLLILVDSSVFIIILDGFWLGAAVTPVPFMLTNRFCVPVEGCINLTFVYLSVIFRIKGWVLVIV